jgi:type IV secretion system protein TrbI
VAALFSSTGKKTPAQQAAAKGQPPQPTLQDNTDNNVQDMKNQVQAERQKEQQAANIAAAAQDPALTSAAPAQQAAAAAFGPSGEASTSCGSVRPCGQAQQGTLPPQLTPEQQQAQLIAAKERERIDNSRFASNPVFPEQQQPQQPPQAQGQMMPAQYDHTERQAKTNPVTAPEHDL